MQYRDVRTKATIKILGNMTWMCDWTELLVQPNLRDKDAGNSGDKKHAGGTSGQKHR